MTVFLDAAPLRILTNPKRPPETVLALRWAVAMVGAGHTLVVPAIADYEARRELERARKSNGIATLDAWNSAHPSRYLPLTDSALRLAAKLWARARNAGTPTADPRELDADVLIAAQALDTQISTSDFIIPTQNVAHMAQFVPADKWSNIKP